ncbi:MAG: hypothetical protein JXA33_10475 [Anaerolineae bacterium]|nr:hypothetical protein [Anaerolineae bacterium]
MATFNLLLHLPNKNQQLESSPQLIEAYCSLVEAQDYAWLCKPGSPLEDDLRQKIEQALHRDHVGLFLFVRLNIEAQKVALYHGRLLDIQGPGQNADKGHCLKGFQKRGCGTWLKIAELQMVDADYIHCLYDTQTDGPVPIWTDLRTDCYVVTEGEAFVPQSTPEVQPWLLCLNQKRARDEFERTWRFRPLATYQPGSAAFIRAQQNGEPLVILAYDRVFGGDTYLKLLSLYDVAALISQGTEAGALVYALQLREGQRFPNPPTLNPREHGGLWGKLHIDQKDWDACASGERILLPLSTEDYEYILEEAGVPSLLKPSALTEQVVDRIVSVSKGTESVDHSLREALAQLDTIMAGPANAMGEKECYHLLRVVERTLRIFIERELSHVDPVWWDSGRVPSDSRIRAMERKQKREHPFPWMGQQDLPVQEYLDFSDYAEIITTRRNWNEIFEAIFLQQDVIRGKLIELSIFRNDIAHMRPLQAGDKAVFLAYAWQVLGVIFVLK